MTVGEFNILNGIAAISVISVSSLFISPAAHAEDFTAEVLIRDYDVKQMTLFVSGVIEGLAQARYENDGKDPAGAKCIYDWYYDDAVKSLSDIQINFIAHKTAAPAAVISAMVNRECPL